MIFIYEVQRAIIATRDDKYIHLSSPTYKYCLQGRQRSLFIQHTKIGKIVLLNISIEKKFIAIEVRCSTQKVTSISTIIILKMESVPSSGWERFLQLMQLVFPVRQFLIYTIGFFTFRLQFSLLGRQNDFLQVQVTFLHLSRSASCTCRRILRRG